MPGRARASKHDETKGWIFSNEYHQWQDKNRSSSGSYRLGSEDWLEKYGWFIGLFTMKEDDLTESQCATWPVPRRWHSILYNLLDPDSDFVSILCEDVPDVLSWEPSESQG